MQAGEFEELTNEMDNRMPDLPEIDQLRKDELYDLEPQGSGQIRIMLQWIYSKVKLLEDILLALRFQIHRDKHDKALKEMLIEDYKKPFGGFLKATVANKALNTRDVVLMDAFTKFGTPTEEETKLAKDVEDFIVKKGFKVPKWARATFIMTAIFLIITLMIHFYKADFVNLTVCTVAIHLLSNAKDAQPKHFRYLVAGTILSFVYDVLWMILRGYDMSGGDNDEESGGVEAKIKRFSFFMVWIGLVCKVIMTFVYWMASLKFEDIIDERSTLPY